MSESRLSHLSRPARRTVVALSALVAFLALPASAWAMTEPLPSSTAPAGPPVLVEQTSVGFPFWQLVLVAAVAAVLGALAVLLGTAVRSAERRRAHTQPA